ncbi:MAG TPA: cupin domain-containing protein [Thermoguttaceae bacterium]|nr:cupin domain-containing protein [Thermoguttaceae bacterium]
MSGKFVPAAEAVRQQLDWGSLGWCSRPADTSAEKLVVIEVTLAPGGGHAFHKHPRQEEVIYVIDGQVEQWREDELRVLRPGDSVFLPAGTVHASFNTADRDAKLLAILSPAVNDEDGYEVVEVADEAPWNGLR